ncbi:unnamed protein product [Caretta caretta]
MSPEEKDMFYHQIAAKNIQSALTNDTLLELGDFSAMTGCSQTGFETMIGPFGSGSSNDTTTQNLTLCAIEGLSVMGS